jgi:hypothetical protein
MEAGSRPASRAISRNFGRASAISPGPAVGILSAILHPDCAVPVLPSTAR